MVALERGFLGGGLGAAAEGQRGEEVRLAERHALGIYAQHRSGGPVEGGLCGDVSKF